MRTAFLDHIRVYLTALVVFHHTAIAYGGSGGWYWRERENASSLLLLCFNAINQSYFMGFFFLISGYFTAASWEHKPPGSFVRDRVLRLGIPLLVYFFGLSTLTLALLEGGPADVPGRWLEALLATRFHPGPLWFAETLLIFTAGFMLWRRLSPVAATYWRFPGFGVLLLAALLLGLVSFLVRLVMPVGEEILWLQLGYFPVYIFLFYAGCLAWPGRLLERVRRTEALPWMLVAVAGMAVLPWVILHRPGEGPFEGGQNLNALFYAFWDPLVGWGIILGMLWLLRAWVKSSGGLGAWLSRRAYLVFILHPPVLVSISRILEPWQAHYLVKFGVTGSLTCLACVLLASLVLRIPGAKRVV